MHVLRPPHLQTVMMKFPFLVSHPFLLCFRLNDSDDEVLVPQPPLSCLSYTSCPFVRPAPPHRRVAVADALLGMVNLDFFFFFTLCNALHHQSASTWPGTSGGGANR
jgi:hypothetical protein